MALGLTGEDRVEATGGEAGLAESYTSSAKLFSSIEQAVGVEAAQSAEAFFNHITSNEDTMWFWENGNGTEGSAQQLAFFEDNAALQEELFQAAKEPGFWASRDAIATNIQNVIINSDNVTNEQLMAFVVSQNPELEGLANIMRDDAELAASFRNALQRDPSMAVGFAGMADGDSSFNLQRLEAALENDMQRDIFRQVLDKIAESPDDQWNFGTLQTLSGHLERNNTAAIQTMLADMDISTGMEIDFLAFFIQLMQDPEAAMANLTETLVASGQLDAEHAGMFMSVGSFAGGLLKGSTFGAVYDVVQNHGGAQAVGQQIMTDLDANGTDLLERNGVLRDGVFTRAQAGEIDPEAVSANPRTPDAGVETRVAAAPVAAPVVPAA